MRQNRAFYMKNRTKWPLIALTSGVLYEKSHKMAADRTAIGRFI
jgi:hypothetical protein